MKKKQVLLITGAVVLVAAAYLTFLSVRHVVRQRASYRITLALNSAEQRVNDILDEIETVTNDMKPTILSHMQPDSLLTYSRRVVEQGIDINGCSITTEPDYFPEMGRYFSAYSIREGDSIITVREGEYEYFEKVWYKTPRTHDSECWVDPYDDFNAGTLYEEDVIVSYCVPLNDKQGRFVGVIATDLSLPWLTKSIAAEKPYPNAFCMMLGNKGNFYIHPDTTRLIHQTIFDGVDPQHQPELISLGYQMITGEEGSMRVTIDGKRSLVVFRQIPKTQWSIAFVCPEDDIFVNLDLYFYIGLALLIALLIVLAIIVRKVSS